MSYSALTQYYGFGDATAPTAPPDPAPASNPMALSASDVVPPLLIALVAVVGIGYLLSSRPSMRANKRKRRGKKRGRARSKRRGWKRSGRSRGKRRGRKASRRSRGKRRGRSLKGWGRRKWGRKKAKRGKRRGRKSWKRGYRNVPWKYAGHRGAKHAALYGTRKYKNTKKGRKKWARKAARRYHSVVNYHGGRGASGWSKSSGGSGWGAYTGPQSGVSSTKAGFGPPGWT